MKGLCFTGLLVWLFFGFCVERVEGAADNQYLQQYSAYTDSLFDAFGRGNNYKARAYASKALIAARQGRLEYQTAIAYSNLSVVNGRMGDLEAANNFSFKALRIFTKLNDTLQIARCNLSIGSLHISLKEYDKAHSYITQARDAFYQMGDMLGYSICLTNLGSVYTARGEYGKALPDFYEALSIDEKSNDTSGMTSNYINIGKIYEKLDNNVQAKEFFLMAYSLAKASGNKSSLGTALSYLAMIKVDEGKLDEALALAKRSLAIRDESGELQGKRFTLELLSEIYQKMGDNDKSLSLFKEATAIKDSLFDLDRAARIATLEEKFINERLINENLSLKFVNEIHNTRITAQRRITFSVIGGLITAVIAIFIITIQLRKKNSAYKFLVEKNLKYLNQEAEIYKLRMHLEGVEEKLSRVIGTRGNSKSLAGADSRADAVGTGSDVRVDGRVASSGGLSGRLGSDANTVGSGASDATGEFTETGASRAQKESGVSKETGPYGKQSGKLRSDAGAAGSYGEPGSNDKAGANAAGSSDKLGADARTDANSVGLSGRLGSDANTVGSGVSDVTGDFTETGTSRAQKGAGASKETGSYGNQSGKPGSDAGADAVGTGSDVRVDGRVAGSGTSDVTGEFTETGSSRAQEEAGVSETESELEKTRTIILSPEEQKRLIAKLEKLMGTEKVFTRTDLTIDKLARRLSTNRTYLSQLINEVYGKNYPDFINMYRVNEAMRLLADPVMGSKYSIEAISREAGFNTISTFNFVFRKTIGITPSIFRKNATNTLPGAENNTYDFTNSASF